MTKHLRWLTRPVPGIARGALALSVYAEPDETGAYKYNPARESGYEGVACVDDAARAAGLFCRIWQTSRRPSAAMSAKGYLAFVVGMQEDDGRFSNFILDWSGRRNRTGPTSVAGGEWWTARALAALASGYATFGNPEYAGAFRRGIESLQLHGLGAGAAAQAILAMSRFWRATGERGLLPWIDGLVDVVAAQRDGVALIDDSETNGVHLWSRYLEVALVEAGNVLVRPTLGCLAMRSADAVLVPAARQLAWDAPVLPSEAGCTARALLYLYRSCQNRAYQDLAQRAAAWFVGANAAREPVYDPAEQRFYDGVDAGPVRSRNAGAESNVEGALTLTLLSRPDIKEFR